MGCSMHADVAFVDEQLAILEAMPDPLGVPCHRDWQPRNWVIDDAGSIRAFDFERSRPAPWHEDLYRLWWNEWAGRRSSRRRSSPAMGVFSPMTRCGRSGRSRASATWFRWCGRMSTTTTPCARTPAAVSQTPRTHGRDHALELVGGVTSHAVPIDMAMGSISGAPIGPAVASADARRVPAVLLGRSGSAVVRGAGRGGDHRGVVRDLAGGTDPRQGVGRHLGVVAVVSWCCSSRTAPERSPSSSAAPASDLSRGCQAHVVSGAVLLVGGVLLLPRQLGRTPLAFVGLVTASTTARHLRTVAIWPPDRIVPALLGGAALVLAVGAVFSPAPPDRHAMVRCGAPVVTITADQHLHGHVVVSSHGEQPEVGAAPSVCRAHVTGSRSRSSSRL